MKRVNATPSEEWSGLKSSHGGEPVDLNRHHNNFGILRLLLAGLVVLSHSPELMDGDPHREIFHRIFGAGTFGGVAVSGFFLISGFLIVKSWCSNPKLSSFITKRVLRIYPGFAVATIISIVVVLSLAAASPVNVAAQCLTTLKNIVTLNIPWAVTAVRFRHYETTNGAMWTIRYEFICYVLVALAGVIGLAREGVFWFGMLILGLLSEYWPKLSLFVSRTPIIYQMPNFIVCFSVGALFYVYRDRIVYSRVATLLASIGLVALLFQPSLIQIGIASLGAYVLFAAAFAKAPRGIGHIGSNNDISYGLYLYAWPIQQLLILFAPGIGLVTHVIVSLVLASLMGLLSWRFIESPALRLGRAKPKQSPA